jgi:hypothetical protein
LAVLVGVIAERAWHCYPNSQESENATPISRHAWYDFKREIKNVLFDYWLAVGVLGKPQATSDSIGRAEISSVHARNPGQRALIGTLGNASERDHAPQGEFVN